jgi:nitroreductase
MHDFYAHEKLMTVDPVILRAMIVERTHHMVEIQLYEALAKGRPLRSAKPERVRQLLAVWQERGLPLDWERPDWVWVKAVLEMAKRASQGEPVDLSPYAWKAFSEDERAVARQLIHQRRSVRHWTDETVPDWMIDNVLQAGLAAPHGCNLCSLRFLVVREKNAPGLFRGSDIPGGPVHIVACQDKRAYQAQQGSVTNPEMVQRNRLLDCGAAMQNMALMAHSLGLGACWLTFGREGMRQRLGDHFKLDEAITIVTYLDLGFPAQTPMPPGRMSLDEVVLGRV